ncbi:MAG: MASE4 domain-containing protein [Ferrovibrionaceae bacterium]
MENQGIFLSTLPAEKTERRMAIGLIVISAISFSLAVPFADRPLPPVQAFIPAYEAALVVIDLITAALVFGQAAILRSRSLMALATGYLFTGLIVIPHALTFPGLVTPTGMFGAGPQTTAWLYMIWHAGFPAAVIAYVLLKRGGDALPANLTAGRAVLTLAAAAVLTVVLVTLLVTAGRDSLPAIMQGNGYTPVMKGVVATVWLMSAVALAILWSQPGRSALDLWLMVVMCAWLADIGLSAVFNAGRFDLGFYAGRIYGLLAASFVLVVLLVETATLYARAVRDLSLSNQALREAEGQQRHLARDLEQRVEESGRQLDAETAERRRIQERLIETQKREAVGRLAGGVAHDFNNILMVVMGNAELLHLPGRAAEHERAIEAIERAAERGGRLVRQLMAFSRRRTLTPGVVDLPARSAELAELLDRSLRGDIKVVLRLDAGLWPIFCDVDELELALLNLCINARDAMPDGGLIRIEGRNVEEAGGQFVALSVSDTGTGIAPEHLQDVFEPFFTTKEVGKGSGLGLAQVQGFAQESGGFATIASTPGQGTTVALHLPRADGHDAAPDPNRPATTQAAARRRVLMVEDDDDVAAIAAKTLAMLGCETQHVRDARTALAVLLGGQRFDVLFSDLIMPGGMGGLDLARKVRQHFPTLPILLASGSNAAAAETSRDGFAIIAKPYRADVLAAALERACRDAADGTVRDTA